MYRLGSAELENTIWTIVRYDNRYYFAPDLTCVPMKTLWSEVQPQLDQYSEILAMNPDDVDALIGHAQQYSQLGEYELALADLEHALEINPESGLAHGWHQLILNNLGRLNELWAEIVPPNLPPAELYDESSSLDWFEDVNSVFYLDHGWSLVYFPVSAYVSVPLGWQAVDRISSGYLLYPPSTDYEGYEVLLRFSSFGYEGDDRTSAEAAAELIEAYSAESNYVVIDHAIIDAHSGYLLVDMVEDDQHYYLVVGFAESLNFGWFHLATAFTREPERWDDYFPVIQAIFAHLRTVDSAPAPIRLPDSLIDLSAFEVE
jgi:tetratricopeptide (TPR) repeat protein